MAKKAKKAGGKGRKATLGNAFYFFIKCDFDGLIVGASSPDEDLDGTVKRMADIKFKLTANGVALKEITFQKDGEFGSCVWKQIGGKWKCV